MTFKNINVFAGQPDFLGGKTGFLEESRGNLLTLFKIQNRVFLFIVFGAEDRFEQTRILYSWTKALF
jgi:D-alanyl-D-alanine carboxypeptidase